MNRTEVIQNILNKKKIPTYLEIGVNTGHNFFQIKAMHKIAIDPKFSFSTSRKIKWLFKNPTNFRSRYFEITSDEFFENYSDRYQPDVIFVDGLHTAQQSLKDVNNALTILKENGVIIMHDCHPPNKAAAHPAESLEDAVALNLPGWTNEWCGDVWKTACHLRLTRGDLNIFVLDTDFGLGIITKGKPDNPLNASEEDIEKMSYEHFEQNKKEYLNLKDKSFLFEFLKTIECE